MQDAPASGRPDWHGRRRGRRLRTRRQQLLTELLPRLRIDLPRPGVVLDPASLFRDRPAEIWLEVGFGSGEHAVEQARRRPDIGFIGCEVFVNGIAALLAGVERSALTNLRIFDDDARLLMAVLPEASLSRVFLLFPDPWPKARHAKRRFIGERNVAVLSRLLATGGELRVATDDPGYVRWTLQHLSHHPDFRWRAAGPSDWREPPADWVETRYQRKAEATSRRVVFLAFERLRRAGG
jgi:tRNA (guanine-N7-)-methyltransferase